MPNEVYSSLTNLIKWTENSSARKEKIRFITPHCTAIKAKGLTIASQFCDTARKASANYVIGSDIAIVANVPENRRAWTSSSAWNDQRAITIECASGHMTPYEFCEGVYNRLIDLSADIVVRNGYSRLIYLGSLDATKNALSNSKYSDAMFVTLHKWYASKQCPGMWMINRLHEYCDEVNRRIGLAVSDQPERIYKVQVGAFKNFDNAKKMADNLKMLGFDTLIIF